MNGDVSTIPLSEQPRDATSDRPAPVGWFPIFVVLAVGVGVALILTLAAQFSAGFMVEDFCSAVGDGPGDWKEMANPYSVRWFSGPPECYRVAPDGTLLVATDSTLAWKLFIGTVAIPTLAGLTVSAIGFRVVSRRRPRTVGA